MRVSEALCHLVRVDRARRQPAPFEAIREALDQQTVGGAGRVGTPGWRRRDDVDAGSDMGTGRSRDDSDRRTLHATGGGSTCGCWFLRRVPVHEPRGTMAEGDIVPLQTTEGTSVDHTEVGHVGVDDTRVLQLGADVP
jgi:hypothetical protein